MPTSTTTSTRRISNRNAGNLGAAQRDAYRGRDDARAKAQQTLQNRTGQQLGGNASERVQGIHQGGGANQNLQNRAQNLNRDNALRGAGDGNAARPDAQRGQASRAGLAGDGQHAGGGFGAHGGGPGAQGGGVQRGGGNLGGGGGGFGGGGGGRLGGGGGGHMGRRR